MSLSSILNILYLYYYPVQNSALFNNKTTEALKCKSHQLLNTY